MTLRLVFDDTLLIPDELKALVGVAQFGSLVFQRRSRLDAMRAAARDAGAAIVHLQSADDRARLIQELREANPDQPLLLCPSHLVPLDPSEHLVIFLKQLQYAPSGLHIPVSRGRERRGWVLTRAPQFRELLTKQQEGKASDFFEQHGHTLVDVPDRLRLVDVSDARNLLDFLSGQFDARLFNAMEHDAYTVLKRSHDRTKLKREFDYYHLIPPALQMFMVQPFDFQDDGKHASYRMERLCVPDVALQWVHRAFQAHEFGRFLEHVFYFLSLRPKKPVSKSELTAVRTALYVDKVKTRIASLKQLPVYAELSPFFERAFGGIDALVSRYLALYERHQRDFPQSPLVIGHGDPCFSNILYSKTNQYLKLIDPRGAASEADLYTDPYYDVAKLSHSIQGAYDFLNHDKFEIRVDEKLVPTLTIEDPPPAFAPTMFVEQLEQAGFDATLTRLFEASLFISMLPLHVDRPRKVLAFALNASAILDRAFGAKETTR